MIIALLALALAMIVSGLLAVFFGWDIVLIERGWVMVIAGSFSASCGALLLGITAAVSRLTRIQSELTRLQLDLDEGMREERPSSSSGLSTAALAGGLLGGRMLDRGETGDDEKQPDLPLFSGNGTGEPAVATPETGDESRNGLEPFPPFPPRTEPERAEGRGEEERPEVRVPDFLLAERRRETYAETRSPPADSSLFADEPVLDAREEERRSAAEFDDVLAPQPEPAREPEPAANGQSPAGGEPAGDDKGGEEKPSGATIIGTYNSGDNTYVMFSDGSIEAQTPAGVFRFQSLDELKAFIASGGEGNSGGGAI